MKSFSHRGLRHNCAVGISVVLSAVASASSLETIPISTSPPGGFDPEEVPQMIVITFDDAVQEEVFGLLNQIEPHQNPGVQKIVCKFSRA